METKLNIANILKDKPSGTKLYADAFGELKLERVKVNEVDAIYTKNKTSTLYCFYNDGKYNKNGEPILVPSKEMRDWSKFSWKKGDVLVSNDYGTEVIFYDWYDDTYTNFYGKHRLDSEYKNNIKYNDAFLCTTGRYSLEDKDAAQTYINTIEERLGGKLNLETLEIEKQPEFKDGDVLFVKCKKSAFIEIFEYSKNNGDLYDHASLDITNQILDISGKYIICKDQITELRLATEEEKQQLFSALEKEGKAWDSEKKQIVDLKPKCEFKPFDKVLVRDSESQAWQVSLFSYKDSDSYYCCNGCSWNQCIPYIGNESLLGTTKDVEG